MAILLKHVRQAASTEDGARVLVDRSKLSAASEKRLKLRAWLPVLAPSDELCCWFLDKPRQWPLFRRRYLAELCDLEATDALTELHVIAASAPDTTLLTASKELEHSHAAILRDLLEGAKKPPATSGPARAAAGGRIRARRNR